jgi:rSAM/selenodomain-associated transferase 1
MSREKDEPAAIVVIAKAPVPGYAKTRLMPELGPERAAALQARLTERAVEIAVAAVTGPVTLWAAPDESHPTFQLLAGKYGLTLARQPDGDLGARMLAAMTDAAGPSLVIGTDCPVLTVDHLRRAADALRADADVVVIPVEDGGYALIGTRCPQPELFSGIAWSTMTVMAETRSRIARIGLRWRELPTLWDIDRPEDLDRLRGTGLGKLIPPGG